MPTWGDLAKPSRTARKKEKRESVSSLRTKENVNKKAAKQRDSHRCRFPLCGCKSLGLVIKPRLESSHDKHKGMGGNPTGDRSTPAGLITLCDHRHQYARFSRGKGTMRNRYLTSRGSNGPVAWDLDAVALLQECHGKTYPAAWSQRLAAAVNGDGWFEVARESKVGVLEPLDDLQTAILRSLAEMEL